MPYFNDTGYSTADRGVGIFAFVMIAMGPLVHSPVGWKLLQLVNHNIREMPGHMLAGLEGDSRDRQMHMSKLIVSLSGWVLLPFVSWWAYRHREYADPEITMFAIVFSAVVLAFSEVIYQTQGTHHEAKGDFTSSMIISAHSLISFMTAGAWITYGLVMARGLNLEERRILWSGAFLAAISRFVHFISVVQGRVRIGNVMGIDLSFNHIAGMMNTLFVTGVSLVAAGLYVNPPSVAEGVKGFHVP